MSATLRIKFVNSNLKDLLIRVKAHYSLQDNSSCDKNDVTILNSTKSKTFNLMPVNFISDIYSSSLISHLKFELQRLINIEGSSPRIRLIGYGRLISDAETIESLFKNRSFITLHCLIDTDDDCMSEQQQQPMLMGFDRLLEMGLSSDEVQELRRQFHAIRSIDSTTSPISLQTNDFDSGNSIRIEEDWFSVTSDNLLDSESFFKGDLEFLAGLCIGFFFGLVIAFFLKEGGDVFSRSTQKGIGLGLLLNFVFGSLTSILYKDSYNPDKYAY